MNALQEATTDELLGELKGRGEAWLLLLVTPPAGLEGRQYINYYGGELTTLLGMVERARIKVRSEVLAADFGPDDDDDEDE